MDPGTRLGHYEILGPLGAGGMGEVYRARDTRLDRDVAIKVLPELFAADVERLARFKREAKLLAQLNHSNIATIHGLEDADGVRFIAMECVEGETLAAQLERGPLPMELALAIGGRIADALEAAHDKGIIHRDLKPANIMLTADWKVKVLDFGLAKASEAEAPARGLSDSPTIAVATQAGVILGTAAYMSPEQARGQRLDKRTDIWSFGVVLLEMLTGRSTFAAGDVSETLAAILKDEPAWDQLPAGVPPALRSVLRRCLRKDPNRRIHHIVDARLEIEDVATDGFDAEPATAGSSPQAWQMVAVALAGLTLGGALVGAWMAGSDGGADSVAVTTYVELAPPDDVQLGTSSSKPYQVASPDGSLIVFRGLSEETRSWQLYRRNLRDGSVVAIAGTEGGSTSFFSPDGEYLAFFAGGQLRKVPVEGGAAEVLAEAPNHWGGTWGPNGEIIYVPDVFEGLWAVSDRGGIPRRLTRPLPQHELDHGPHCYPSFLPGGGAVLFQIWSGGTSYSAAILDLTTGDWRVVLEHASSPQYARSGHLVFGRDTSVWAAPFDLDTRTLGEPRVPVVSNVGPAGKYPSQFHVSQAGVLVYQGRGTEPMNELVAVDLSGTVTPLGAPPRNYLTPRFSPDGSKIAVAVGELKNRGVWMFDLAAKTLVRVTPSGQGDALSPHWTDEGQTLVFQSDQGGKWEVWRRSADGVGEPVFFAPWGSDAFWVFDPHFSRDGRVMVGAGRLGPASGSGMARGILYASISDPTDYKVLVPGIEGVGMYSARPSPDGTMVAYVSLETGQAMVYVTPLPGPGARRPVSAGGSAGSPVWSGDGATLFFEQDGSIHAVDIVDVEDLVLSSPRELISTRDYAGDGNYTTPDYDVAPDGESFVMTRPIGEPAPPTHLKVILDWFEELEERVPVPKGTRSASPTHLSPDARSAFDLSAVVAPIARDRTGT